jgi:hypothetical protein
MFNNWDESKLDITNNPTFLAGLSVMRGTPVDQALAQASLMQQQKQAQQQQMLQQQMQQQQIMRQQQMQEQLPQMLQQLQGKNPQEVFVALRTAGLDTKEAATIAKYVGQVPAASQLQMFAGPGNVRYQIISNPETGEMEAKPLAGQIPVNSKPKLSVSEMRINSSKLTQLDNDARAAEKELRLLADSDKAFKTFDSNTGSYTGPGSLASKFIPKGVENIIYNKKAQTAKQEIDKLNSQLFQNRVAALGARGTDVAKQEIMKGLPTIMLNPEARHELIATKRRENFEQILRSKFFNEWAKQNQKDLNGAENAFAELVSSVDLIDSQGYPRRELLQQIPEIINGFADNERPPLETKEEALSVEGEKSDPEEEIDNLYAQFEDLPLEALIAEQRRRGK